MFSTLAAFRFIFHMPRFSERRKFLDFAHNLLDHLRYLSQLDFFLGLTMGEDFDAFAAVVDGRIREVENRRYLMDRVILPSLEPWITVLRDTERFNGDYFLRHFRMDCNSFWRLVRILGDSAIFQVPPQSAFRTRAPVALQVLTLLKYLGTEGTDGSYAKVGDSLGISNGSVVNYIHKTTKALIGLRHDVIKWPNHEERRLISDRMKEKFGFDNCIGMVDGTLYPLEFKPTHNGEEYFTRKSSYAVNSLLFVDDTTRVRYITAGYPGSVHDNRVWRNCHINIQHEKYFSSNEYLLGDSAFTPSPIMVPPFKKPNKSQMGSYEKMFNTKLAKARIRTEHTIGLIKARFPQAKRYRLKIDGKKAMKKLIKQTVVCAILHNMLLQVPLPDNATLPQAHTNDHHYEDDTINNSGNGGTTHNDERRQEVMGRVLDRFNH